MPETTPIEAKRAGYEQSTGNIYGTLFTSYDEQKFDESVDLFRMRQEKWGVDLNWFKGKSCLDAGCGGGRFLVALSRLGAGKVTGIDISDDAIAAANNRLETRGFSGIAHAEKGSVLSLPFADNTFDYVVCSGVIHHTPDPQRAYQELVRVVKPGGRIFLSVYGIGGFFWMINDLGRLIGKVIPFKAMDAIWKAIGVPPNKRYNYLDNLYVPFCYRYREDQIRSWLMAEGFHKIRRVKFERYDYEHPWSRFMHGEGWLQFFAEKK